MTSKTYTWVIYEFTDKEIDQIVELVKLWSAGNGLPIDRRRFTRQVLKYAEYWGLIKQGKDCVNWNWETSQEELAWYVKSPERWYISNELNKFDPVYNMPQEALWRIVKEIIETSPTYNGCIVGYSITKNPLWQYLNLYNANSSSFSNDDLEQMSRIFNTLAQFRYVIFQQAGSIWQITNTENQAIRTEYRP